MHIMLLVLLSFPSITGLISCLPLGSCPKWLLSHLMSWFGTCVVPGWSGDKALTSVERYYPDLECWEHVTNLSTPRCFHAAAVDESGRIFGLGESYREGAVGSDVLYQ